MGGVESPSAALLARGPWAPEDVDVRWHQAAYEPSAELSEAADAHVAALSERGSPAHDGMAARMRDHEARDGGLWLELQPARWSLRLVEGDAMRLAHGACAWCAARTATGWRDAGPRGWPPGPSAGPWAPGARWRWGRTPWRRSPASCDEEWQLRPLRTSVEALVRLPNGVAMLVGQATVSDDAAPVMDAEHDEYAWWPPDPESWPEEADWRLRRMGALLA